MYSNKYDKFLNKKVKVKTANGTTYKGKLEKYYFSNLSYKNNYILLTKKHYAPIKIYEQDIISIKKHKKIKNSYPDNSYPNITFNVTYNVTYINNYDSEWHEYLERSFPNRSTKSIDYTKTCIGNIDFD